MDDVFKLSQYRDTVRSDRLKSIITGGLNGVFKFQEASTLPVRQKAVEANFDTDVSLTESSRSLECLCNRLLHTLPDDVPSLLISLSTDTEFDQQ